MSVEKVRAEPLRCVHCAAQGLINADGYCGSCGREWNPEDVLVKSRWQDHDPVNHPKHYLVHGPQYQPAVICRVWKLSLAIGQAVIYLLRAPYKGNQIEDYKKAVWWINNEIEALEAENQIKSKTDPS